MQRHADPAGARKLARAPPVITALDLIRDIVEHKRLEAAEDGGRRRRTRGLAAATSSQSSQPSAKERSTPLLRPSADKEGSACGSGDEWGVIGDGTPKGTVGVKRKPSKRTTARHKRRQKAQDMQLED